MAFGIGSGDKIAIWSFADKGTYGECSITGAEKNKAGKWEKCLASKFTKVLGRAYEEVKSHQPIPENSHLDAKIGYGYEVEGKYGTYTQKPFSVSNFSEEYGFKYQNYTIFDLTIVESKNGTHEESKSNQSSVSQPAPVETPSPKPTPAPQNVTPQEEPIRPTTNGLIGLDFLNVPDTASMNLPFK